MSVVEVVHGNGPVVIGLPHTGTDVPPDVWARLDAEGRRLRDTDWHVERLYAGLLPGATMVRGLIHRYVIDVNRPPGGESLYPGQATTDLVTLTDFDGQRIWENPPSPEDTAARLAAVHIPYHAAMTAELERVRGLHGVAIHWDAHSIRSRTGLFEGVLPDLNVGTDGGVTCDPRVEAAVWGRAEASGLPCVLNGRFRGGWTTRHYGRPRDGVHAIQMEISQHTYLAAEAPPFAYDEARAARLRPVLAGMLHDLAALAPSLRS